jgi:hypothetical protein
VSRRSKVAASARRRRTVHASTSHASTSHVSTSHVSTSHVSTSHVAPRRTFHRCRSATFASTRAARRAGK